MLRTAGDHAINKCIITQQLQVQSWPTIHPVCAKISVLRMTCKSIRLWTEWQFFIEAPCSLLPDKIAEFTLLPQPQFQCPNMTANYFEHEENFSWRGSAAELIKNYSQVISAVFSTVSCKRSVSTASQRARYRRRAGRTEEREKRER